MSVSVDYTLYAECSDEELEAKLNRVRRRALDLPVLAVSEVRRYEPIFQSWLLTWAEQLGVKVPPAVKERVKNARKDKDEDPYARSELAFMLFSDLPTEVQLRFYEPVNPLLDDTEWWRAKDYPEEFKIPFFATVRRSALLTEFAKVMLAYGYLLSVHPGEGCEPVRLGLCTFHADRLPLWAGAGTTKTQYAEDFKQAHENVCRVLDLAAEEGLVYKVFDVCEYYEHRDWARSAAIVNQETAAIASIVKGVVSAIAKTDEDIELVSAPILQRQNYVEVVPEENGDRTRPTPDEANDS